MNHTLEQAEKAVNWFNSHDIPAEIRNKGEDVQITVIDYCVYISSSEIEYRAELWNEEEQERNEKF